MAMIEGTLDAAGLRFGIVASKFNEFVTGRLLAGALEVLDKAGAGREAVDVVRVPGAFEIALVARRLARSRRYDAVICLGAVIRGETPHFEYISAEASRGIAQAAWESDLPVVFGVLTTDTVEQAMERAGSPERNRGADAARTAIEMATLIKKLRGTGHKVTSRKLAGRRVGIKRTGRKR
ncbi:MAG: 6,7-dimethyl-8-ribityllumazine synthase [Nitrospira sp.]|nr:6,7-dimethyl-8-ribityllumazine synthase [Nitrospira sp.]